MNEQTQTAGTPAAAPSPPAAPVVGTSTGESFMPPAAGTSAPASTPAAPSAAPDAAGASSGQPGAKTGAKQQPRLTLTNDELRDRLARAKASALKDVFGTDDAAAIRERLAKAEALEKQAEEQKRAQMTEQQRMQHDLARAKAERDRYRNELAQAQEREIVREQTSFVERVAAKHVNPNALEEASLAFARKVAMTDPKIVAKWTERDIDAWFKRYVSEKPFMAASAAAPAPPKRVERRPAGAASPPPRPSSPSGPATNGAKSLRPGQPNSMSREEARAEARRRGYSWLQIPRHEAPTGFAHHATPAVKRRNQRGTGQAEGSQPPENTSCR